MRRAEPPPPRQPRRRGPRLSAEEKKEKSEDLHDKQKGVLQRSPLYDLPYFKMCMVQYDLMHTAMGVLSTFNKGYATEHSTLFVKPAARAEVPPTLLLPPQDQLDSSPPPSQLTLPLLRARWGCAVVWVGGAGTTAGPKAWDQLVSQGVEASDSNQVPPRCGVDQVGSWRSPV